MRLLSHGDAPHCRCRDAQHGEHDDDFGEGETRTPHASPVLSPEGVAAQHANAVA
jgi:hypothetical protein